ncbi:MAG: thioredoxin domain-containing protein [archaeon]
MSKLINKTNNLINEKSPYLKQHAHNPVNWYPWKEKVFNKAQSEEKPIFLSIGYSTCHWCHVMAEESFESKEVAKLLNKNFISIKVDREERPDIDNIYMNVCQLLTGSAGWPLSIFMTFEKKPFYADTYIPKNNKYGKPGLITLLEKINKLWNNNREKLLSIADDVVKHLNQNQQYVAGKILEIDDTDNNKIFEQAYETLEASYDNKYGGFGDSPKFPIFHQFIFLLNYWKRYNEDFALKMIEKSLKRMRAGGIYDQIGFGFHRYSTDRRWFLPHFEKMIYDQSLLSNVYLYLYQETKEDIYKKTYKEIIQYCRRVMLSPGKAFYTAEDADVEGEEGKFYLWNNKELSEILSKENMEICKQIFNINIEGNITTNSYNTNEDFNNENIPYLNPENLEIIQSDNFNKIRSKLLNYRINQRKHPEKDTKILTDWNSLMVSSLAIGSWILDEAEYLEIAEKNAEFIINNLINDNDKLLHCYIDNEASIEANLNDYSFFIKALIDLYQASFNVKYLKLAIKLTDQMLELFWDKDNGGFYFISENKRDDIFIRNKKIYDGSIPSGNSIALMNLVKLFYITENIEYENRSRKLSQLYMNPVRNNPESYLQFLISYDYLNNPFYNIIIVGKEDDIITRKMFDILKNNYIPNKVLVFKPVEDKIRRDKLLKLLPHINEYERIDNKTTAYICRDFYCNPPVTEPEQLKYYLTE